MLQSNLNALKLIVRNKDGSLSGQPLAGLAAITAVHGASYTIQDSTTGRAVSDLRFVRDGKSLRVLQAGEEETLIQINDFYTADASMFTGEAYEVADASGKTTAVVPAKEASTVSASDGWFSASALWIGGGAALIGGGALIAASDNNGNDAEPTNLTVTPVTGNFVAGSDATVQVYNANGELLATGTYNSATGQFSATLPEGYVGPILVVVSGGGTNADYVDETTGDATRLDTVLRAMGFARGGDLDITVSPLTELAVRQAGVPDNFTDPNNTTSVLTSDQLDVNDQIATLFGVEDILGPVTTVIDDAYNTGNGTSDAEKYGQVLAQISGADSVSGSLEETLEVLEEGISESNGVLALDTEATNLLDDGRDEFNDSENGEENGVPVPAQNSVSVIVNNDGTFIDRNADGKLDASDDSNATTEGVQLQAANLGRGGNADLQGNAVTVHFEGLGASPVNLSGFGSNDRIVFDMVQLNQSLDLGAAFAGELTDIGYSSESLSYSFRGGEIEFDFTDSRIEINSSRGSVLYTLANWSDRFNYLSSYLNFTDNTNAINAGEGESIVSFEFNPLQLIATHKGVFVDQNQDGFINAMDRVLNGNDLELESVILPSELFHNSVQLTVQGLPEGQALDVNNFGADDRLILDLGGLAARGLIAADAAGSVADVFTGVANGLDRFNYSLAGGNTAFLFRPDQSRVQLYNFGDDTSRDFLGWTGENALADFAGLETDAAALNDGTGEGLVAFRFPVEQPEINVIVNTAGAFLDKNGDGELTSADYVAAQIPEFEEADFSAGGNADLAANAVTIEFEDNGGDSSGVNLTGFSSNDRVVLDLVSLAENGRIVRGEVDNSSAEIYVASSYVSYKASDFNVVASNGFLSLSGLASDFNLGYFTDGSLNALGSFADVGAHAQADEAGDPLVSFIRSREIAVIVNEDGAFIDANADGVLQETETTVADFAAGGNADLIQSVNILVKDVPVTPMDLTGFANDDRIVLDLPSLNGESPNLAAVADASGREGINYNLFNGGQLVVNTEDGSGSLELLAPPPQDELNGEFIDLRRFDANLIVTADGVFNDSNFNNVIDDATETTVTVDSALLGSGAVRIEFRDIPTDSLNLSGFGLDDQLVFNLSALALNDAITVDAAESVNFTDSSSSSSGLTAFEYELAETSFEIEIKFNSNRLRFYNSDNDSTRIFATFSDDGALDMVENFDRDPEIDAINANTNTGLVSFLFSGVTYTVINDDSEIPGGGEPALPPASGIIATFGDAESNALANGSDHDLLDIAALNAGDSEGVIGFNSNLGDELRVIVNNGGAFIDENRDGILQSHETNEANLSEGGNADLSVHSVTVEFEDVLEDGPLNLDGFDEDDRVVLDLPQLAANGVPVPVVAGDVDLEFNEGAALYQAPNIAAVADSDEEEGGSLALLGGGGTVGGPVFAAYDQVLIFNDDGFFVDADKNGVIDLNSGDSVVAGPPDFVADSVLISVQSLAPFEDVRGPLNINGFGSDDRISFDFVAIAGESGLNVGAITTALTGSGVDPDNHLARRLIYGFDHAPSFGVFARTNSGDFSSGAMGFLNVSRPIFTWSNDRSNIFNDQTQNLATRDALNNGTADAPLTFVFNAEPQQIVLADWNTSYNALTDGDAHEEAFEDGNPLVSFIFAEEISVIVNADGAFIDADADGVLAETETTAANFAYGGNADLSNSVNILVQGLPELPLDLSGFGGDDQIRFDIETLVANGDLDAAALAGVTNAGADEGGIGYNLGGDLLQVNVSDEGDLGSLVLGAPVMGEVRYIDLGTAGNRLFDVNLLVTGEGVYNDFDFDNVADDNEYLSFSDGNRMLDSSDGYENGLAVKTYRIEFLDRPEENLKLNGFGTDDRIVFNLAAMADNGVFPGNTALASITNVGTGSSSSYVTSIEYELNQSMGSGASSRAEVTFDIDDSYVSLDAGNSSTPIAFWSDGILNALADPDNLEQDRTALNAGTGTGVVSFLFSGITYVVGQGSTVPVEPGEDEGPRVIATFGDAETNALADADAHDFDVDDLNDGSSNGAIGFIVPPRSVSVIVTSAGAFLDADANGYLGVDEDQEVSFTNEMSDNYVDLANDRVTIEIEGLPETIQDVLTLTGFGADDRLILDLPRLAADDVLSDEAIEAVTRVRVIRNLGNTEAITYSMDNRNFEFNFTGSGVKFSDGFDTSVIANFSDEDVNALADFAGFELSLTDINDNNAEGPVSFVVTPLRTFDVSVIVNHMGAFIDTNGDGTLGSGETLAADFSDDEEEGYVDLANESVRIEFEGSPTQPLKLNGFGTDDRIVMDLEALDDIGAFDDDLRDEGLVSITTTSTENFSDDGIHAEGVNYRFGGANDPVVRVFKADDFGALLIDSDEMNSEALGFWTDEDNALADAANLGTDVRDLNNGVGDSLVGFAYEPVDFLLTEPIVP